MRNSFLPLKGTWKGAHGSNPAEEGVETTDLAYLFIFKMQFMCIEIYNNVDIYRICVLCLFTVAAHISGLSVTSPCSMTRQAVVYACPRPSNHSSTPNLHEGTF